MKQKLLVTTCITLLFSTLLIGCSSKEKINPITNKPITTEEIIINEDINENETIKIPSNTKTTIQNSNLTQTIAILDNIDSNENIMFSPISLNLTLGMLGNGANDIAKKEIETFLGMSLDEYNEKSKNYLTNNVKELTLANSIWLDEVSLQINQNTNEIFKNYYQSEIYIEPFNIDKINNWCNEKTNGMIPIILNEKPDAQLIALNATYFKDEWQEKYEEYDILKDFDFTTFNGEVSKKDFLISKENIYYENEKATAFCKLYKNNRFGFIGILPKQEGNFQVSDLNIEDLLKNKQERVVDVTMPKFTIENTINLKDILIKNNLSSIFDNNFDKLVKNEIFAIDEAIQKTKIIVDENGTKASAITMMTDKNAIIGEPNPSIVLDRPFVYMVYDFENNEVLFIGKFIN